MNDIELAAMLKMTAHEQISNALHRAGIIFHSDDAESFGFLERDIDKGSKIIGEQMELRRYALTKCYGGLPPNWAHGT